MPRSRPSISGRLIAPPGEPKRSSRSAAAESIESYRVLFENHPLPAWVYDVESLRFLAVNEAAIQHYGYTRDEFLRMTVKDIRPPEDIPILLNVLSKLDQGVQLSGIWRHQKKDGTFIDVEVRSTEIPFNGRQARLVLANDVTKQLRLESHLRTEFGMTRAGGEAETLLVAAPRILRLICEDVGYELGEMWQVGSEQDELRWVGSCTLPTFNASEFVDDSRGRTFRRGVGIIGRVWDTGRPIWITDLAKDPNFVRAPQAARAGLRQALAFPIVDRGKVTGVIAFFSRTVQEPDEDLLDFMADVGSRVAQIIELERIEEARRRLEERFRKAFEESPTPIIMSQMSDGHILDVNGSFLRLMGYRREEVIGHTTLELRMWADPSDRPKLIELLRSRDAVKSLETRVRTKSGEIRDVITSIEKIRLANEEAMLSAVIDITDRKRDQEQLAHSERKYRTLFEAAADAIVLVDARGSVLDVNPAGLAIVGKNRDEVLGKNFRELMPASEIPRIEEHLQALPENRATEEPFETYVEAPDGRRSSVQIRTRVIRGDGAEPFLQVIARDITEQKEFQRRLVEHERLASMGQVAAYVAHEINTPLANIGLLTATATRKTTDAEMLEKLEKIHDQNRLAASIVKDLLTWTRSENVTLVECDLRTVIEASLEQMGPYRKEEVSLVTDLGEYSLFAYVDPLRMQQVLVNLVKNALQATTSGSVTVRLEERAQAFAISVSDTGTGMPKEVLDHLFQPFFTTKKRMEGTGLGLAFSKSVVSAHGGTIEVASQEGQGSTFAVLLPRPTAAH